jgi:hypothetical protein
MPDVIADTSPLQYLDKATRTLILQLAGEED